MQDNTRLPTKSRKPISMPLHMPKFRPRDAAGPGQNPPPEGSRSKPSLRQRFQLWRQRLKTRLAAMTPRQQMGAGIGMGCSVLLVIGVLASCMVLASGRPGLPPIGGGGHNGTVSSTATSQARATNAAGTPTAATPTPSCIPGAVNCNPWGYNFTQGSRIFNPASDFCSFFKCIANFWSGKGYVVECRDGTYAKLGGDKHACMRHRGEAHTLLQP